MKDMKQVKIIKKKDDYTMEYEVGDIYYILKEKFEEKLPCIMDKAIRQLKACGSKEMAFQCHGG